MSSLLRALPASTSRSAASSLVASKRLVHKLRPYPNLDLNKGVSGFLSAAQLKTIAVDYQQGLLDRLNEVTKGTEYENLTVLQTLTKSNDDPASSLIFSYASNALNNSLFLDGLTSSTTTWNPAFEAYLDSSFPPKDPSERKMLAFETAFNLAVDNMTAPGWVWLVHEVGPSRNTIAIRVSYGAGSVLYPWRTQAGPKYDLSPRPLPAPRAVTPMPDLQHLPPQAEKVQGLWEHSPADSVGAQNKRGTSSSTFEAAIRKSSPKSDGGEVKEKLKVYPLACLSMHERSYVGTFGFNGQGVYATNWLRCLDWDKVWARTSRREMVKLDEFKEVLGSGRTRQFEEDRVRERLGWQEVNKPVK